MDNQNNQPINNLTNNVPSMEPVESLNETLSPQINPELDTDILDESNIPNLNTKVVNLEQQNIVETPSTNNQNQISNPAEQPVEDISKSFSQPVQPIQQEEIIPQNPVAPKEAKKIDVDKVDYNIKDVLKIFVKLLIKPGTILKENVEKYSSLRNSLLILLTITIFGAILSLISSSIRTATIVNIDAITGAYSTSFDLSRIANQDFLADLLRGVICSGGYILIVSLVYYGTSFFNNKSVRLGTYIMVNNLSALPLIIALNFLYPIGMLISEYVGLSILVILFIYTIVIFLVGTDEILTYKDIDYKIMYNLFNLSIIALIIILLLYLVLTNGWYELPIGISF